MPRPIVAVLLVCAALLLSTACKTTVNEEAAIKALLEKESATWRSGDIKAHAACWQARPYSRMLFTSSSGASFDVPVDNIIHPPNGKLGNGGTSANSNYHFCVYDTSAWVSHDEVSTATDGTQSFSHEIRLLEKVNGDWKLVGQSIHQYVPAAK